MPPKKSDQPRRSDVSDARFVLVDDEPSVASGAVLETIESSAPPPATSSAGGGDAGASATQATSEKGTKEKDRDASKDAVTIEDLTLPKSIITRLAKGVLPPNTQIQGNAILAMTKSAVVFINHLANAANEHTLNGGKKTIMPGDVFRALDDIEFGFLREPLEREFLKFNEVQTNKRNTYRRKVAAAKRGPLGAGGAAGGAGDQDSELRDISVLTTGTEGDVPRAKKAKTDPSGADAGDDEVDADTEPDEEIEEDEEDEAEEDEEEEELEDDGDETQDAMEEDRMVVDEDEALDEGDVSD